MANICFDTHFLKNTLFDNQKLILDNFFAGLIVQTLEMDKRSDYCYIQGPIVAHSQYLSYMIGHFKSENLFDKVCLRN